MEDKWSVPVGLPEDPPSTHRYFLPLGPNGGLHMGDQQGASLPQNWPQVAGSTLLILCMGS